MVACAVMSFILIQRFMVVKMVLKSSSLSIHYCDVLLVFRLIFSLKYSLLEELPSFWALWFCKARCESKGSSSLLFPRHKLKSRCDSREMYTNNIKLMMVVLWIFIMDYLIEGKKQNLPWNNWMTTEIIEWQLIHNNHECYYQMY